MDENISYYFYQNQFFVTKDNLENFLKIIGRLIGIQRQNGLLLKHTIESNLIFLEKNNGRHLRLVYNDSMPLYLKIIIYIIAGFGAGVGTDLQVGAQQLLLALGLLPCWYSCLSGDRNRTYQ